MFLWFLFVGRLIEYVIICTWRLVGTGGLTVCTGIEGLLFVGEGEMFNVMKVYELKNV